MKPKLKANEKAMSLFVRETGSISAAVQNDSFVRFVDLEELYGP
jgi:hypothetical protein